MRESLKNKPAIVYCAVNAINKKKYVGMTSKSLPTRMTCHKCAAIRFHSKTHFHNAIRKHGFENFNFYTLSKWENYKDALDEEVRVIALVNPEYNVSRGGEGFLGNVPSEETRKKQSEARKGRKQSEEWVKKRTATLSGRKRTKEQCDRMSQAHAGKPAPWSRRKHTPEQVEANRLRGLGRKASKETREKMSLARKGREGKPHTEEAKRKMSLAHKGVRPSEETLKKLSIARMGTKRSEETKKKMSDALKLFWEKKKCP